MSSTSANNIDIAYPEAADLRLVVAVGACRLTIAPLDGEGWVAGAYNAPSGMQPPAIAQDGGMVRISQERNPSAFFSLFSGVSKLNLALGKTRPYTLNLKVGASEVNSDLGGLPITRLVAELGAGKVDFDFSAANPEPMSLLEVKAGAVGLQMRNLANANFAEMSIDGGAASFDLDFGGTLQRDAHVKISTGASSVTLRVPAATAVKIEPESSLGNVDVGDGFTKREGAWWNQAALTGARPVLTVHATVNLGSLQLRMV